MPYLSKGMTGIDLGAGLYNDFAVGKRRRTKRKKKK